MYQDATDMGIKLKVDEALSYLGPLSESEIHEDVINNLAILVRFSYNSKIAASTLNYLYNVFTGRENKPKRITITGKGNIYLGIKDPEDVHLIELNSPFYFPSNEEYEPLEHFVPLEQKLDISLNQIKKDEIEAKVNGTTLVLNYFRNTLYITKHSQTASQPYLLSPARTGQV